MRLSTLISFLLLPLAAIASGDEFFFYQAKYRPAEELVRTAEPLFQGKAAISSLNEKIVINAPRKTAEKVLQLFTELDRKPRTYRISLRLVSLHDGEKDSLGMKSGNVTVGKSGARVEGSLQAESREQTGQGESVQVMEVLEGREAHILTGTHWFPGGLLTRVRGGAKGSLHLELRQKEAGFSALGLKTEVSIPAGKWRSLGKVSEDSAKEGSGIMSTSRGKRRTEKNLQVKVEEVP